jgi:hypothetical protein
MMKKPPGKSPLTVIIRPVKVAIPYECADLRENFRDAQARENLEIEGVVHG